MKNLPIHKTDPGSISSARQTPTSQPKTNSSKFDRVRVELQNRNGLVPETLAAKVPTTAHQRTETTTSRQHSPTAQGQNLQDEIGRVETGLAELRGRINSVPRSSAFEPIHQRLLRIEEQFEESGRLLARADSLDNPREFLEIQMTIYRMTQKIEILSKIVDRAVTGADRVLNINV